ncbi:holocytochrome c synthase [Mitosporidium daphniae]|uniref:Holocytochrome c-type synthase n=1 Tax=Mitosporidium daphniae TaxID=1485682 RepID=A0A098VM09_9MICR|nr:cytochrome C1 heme lyase [Mitosporidium daphniae]KGG50108.1 cytochrome C1 heme lyase [Mitosporidium daphniae]|eukprot:XP_013236544.1 cytochrome C1 heme lyase [Mitosporidium daphniae]
MEASEACSSHSSSLDAHNECPYREKKSNINPCTLMPHPEILNATSIDGISSPLSKGLSTERESSTIPKVTAPGHVDETWKYPSPRMFYHALLRKGYATDPQDIDSMLFIHNQLNEGVWKHILEWENFMQPNATGRCQPLLKSFQGRPQKLSPKAWFAHKFLGADKPFDRHDWVIERCGKKVRYVIDYYENGVDQSGSPTMNVCVRPALDSIESIFYRFRRFLDS